MTAIRKLWDKEGLSPRMIPHFDGILGLPILVISTAVYRKFKKA